MYRSIKPFQQGWCNRCASVQVEGHGKKQDIFGELTVWVIDECEEVINRRQFKVYVLIEVTLDGLFVAEKCT